MSEPTPLDLYTDAFRAHLEAGDDDMNARLRIIEAGCDLDMADMIEQKWGENQDDEDDA